MRKWLSYLVIFFLASSLTAQDTLFQRTYGGYGYDVGKSIKVTADNGYIIAGSTGSFGNNSQVYIVKIDSAGVPEWEKTYGGNNVEWAEEIIISSDTNYFLAGYTNTFGEGGYDVYLLKTDTLGDTLWTKTYGNGNWDLAYDMIETSDSNLIICGESDNGTSVNAYLIKTNLQGDTIWTETYGTDSTDVGLSVCELPDSTIMMAGYSKANGSRDYYLVKVDQVTGKEIWSITQGGTGYDVWNEVILTNDNNIGLIGTAEDATGSGKKDMILMKSDTAGTQIWKRTMGGPEDDGGNSIIQYSNGEYLLTGFTESFGGGLKDYYIIKTDGIGYYIVGPTFGESGVFKDDIPFEACINSNNGAAIIGYSDNYGNGPRSAFLVVADSSLNSSNTIYVDIKEEKKNSDNWKIYPNPARDHFTIRNDKVNKNNNLLIKIFDSSGKVVKEINSNESRMEVDCQSLENGFYFISLREKQSQKIYRGKLIIAR